MGARGKLSSYYMTMGMQQGLRKGNYVDGYLLSIRRLLHESIANHDTSTNDVLKFRWSGMPESTAPDRPHLAPCADFC